MDVRALALGRKWDKMTPRPSNFSGMRALGFVLENEAGALRTHSRGIRAFSGAIALYGAWVYNSSK